MADSSPPNFTLRVDHFMHPGGEDAILARLSNLEALMSELGDYVTQFRTAFDAFKARLDEDVAELRRLIAASQATDEEKAAAQTLLDELNTHDLDPNFPPPPPEEEPPAEEPTEPAP